MSARKKTKLRLLLATTSCLISYMVMAVPTRAVTQPLPPSKLSLAEQLGWIESNDNECGGYYLEQPLVYPISVDKNDIVEVTGNEGLISQRITSFLEGKVTVTRQGQQLTANKAYIYRDPTTGKLTAIDMIGDVNLREPNTLIIGKKGRYSFKTKTKALIDIFYRTSMNAQQSIVSNVTPQAIPNEHRIQTLTAWGKAYEFSQTQPKIFELERASYSTCPPINPTWRVKATHIVLNKNTGRGYATNARLLVKNIPILYLPYFNFSIDGQRKSGFLIPTYSGGNQNGPSFYTPFYWNIAPNYDMTITPGILAKRGVMLSENFRYLTEHSSGNFYASALPNDRDFVAFQKAKGNEFINSTDNNVQAEARRLLNDSSTRKAFLWRENSHFNDHWSTHVDFNYAGDDYYLKNFGSNLNEITSNQLLQEGDLFYKGLNWNFTGRLQTYETLHPIDQVSVENQYRRFPQLILNGDYPDQLLGLEYFINNEITHFDLRNTPGTDINKPVGDRLNIQPGISLPLYATYGYINPRFQLALTEYDLHQVLDTHALPSKYRAVPIFDIASGLALNRDIVWFQHPYMQTLEPQVYYTYIPYRNQIRIPVFDTTVNTLTYDQLFNYNRFSGIDRIGDANQIGVGVATRLIDQDTGLEKVRLGIGEIIYFEHRHVTLCKDLSCGDNPLTHSNVQRTSPLTGILNYAVNPFWSFSAYSIWDPSSKHMNNSTLSLHYQPQEQQIINLGYSYARGGDPLSGLSDANDPRNNLKVSDISVAWPIFSSVSTVGRWSQNWNHVHLQNLLFGLQYDTCCWGVRVVAGRAFVGFDPNNNNKFNYDSTGYVQFSLKGLGEVGTGNPSALLSSITGYKTQFGQEI